MAHLLGAESVRLEYPNIVVFEAVTLGVSEGDRIGIVGRNGDGKSSLLGILSGRVVPDEGKVTRRGGLRVGALEQADTLDDASTVGHAIVGDRPDHVWAGEPRIREIIAGLVVDVPWDARIDTLSGGQRRRVALAALLVEDWDLVILDEPTNHLDVEGVQWLADHLRQRWTKTQGGLLVVTHDRWFLDEVCTATWEVHDRIVEPFDGGYAAYVLQRVERDRQNATIEAKRQNLMRKELAWLRRGAPARTSKPKFRIDAANVLIDDVPPPRDRVELAKLATARLGKDVVDIENVSVSYGENAVLTDVTWRIGPGDRLAVLGANGVGKSTLLGLVSGAVLPTRGRVKRGKTVRIGTLDQRFADLEVIADDRVRDVLARTRTTFLIDGRDLTPAQLLERLGFSRDHLSSRVAELSGGQKRRLQLLLVLLDEPNVLILDEPTNDVDTDMLTAMEDLLDSWPGTLLVVSHDRYLVERITDMQYAILGGGLRHLPGGVDEYLRLRHLQNRAVPEAEPRVTTASSAAEQRAMAKALQATERKLARLGERVEAMHVRMAGHDPADYLGLGRLHDELRDLEAEVAELEDAWLELSEQAG
ncbi:MAG TPA: ABC-F family ATP-binding cassette domain-containing protein [Propionibacteriaceae bacterium]